MRFVYVMDPMDRVAADKDTTFAFLRAAQARGHVALHCEPRDLYAKGGDVYARTRTLTVMPVAPYAMFGATENVRLADVDAVLVRKDPPFDALYLYATHLLELARGKTVIINDPRGLRDSNEKLYALHFAQWMPRTLVSSSEEQLLDFLKNEIGGHGVVKPLDLAGGSGVMMLAPGDKNTKSILGLLTGDGQRLVMLQEFLPGVVQGDKRVLLLDGQILGAINRVPRSDDLRSNIHVGGSVEPCEVTDRERAMVADMAPRLVRDGLVFVGLDVIAGKLTEVNVTSPTGIQQLSAHRNRDVAEDVVVWLERAATKLVGLRGSMHKNAL
ncbi:MAG: glutathione synthase [Polyangiaceae bacterium]|nr:glutathione synthase [Polyangiaceae bacterium]